MPESILSNWMGNDVLRRYLVENVTYLACHTADPLPLGDPSTELLAPGYARQVATWGPSASKTTALAAVVSFGAVPAGRITHLGLWSALVAGELLLRWALTTPLDTEDVSPLAISAGDLAVTL